MPISRKEFLEISGTIECRFTIKPVHGMTRTCSQMHRTDKFPQHSSIIKPVWLNGQVFVYKLSGCWTKSHCSCINLFLVQGFFFFFFFFFHNLMQLLQCIESIYYNFCGWVCFLFFIQSGESTFDSPRFGYTI